MEANNKDQIVDVGSVVEAVSAEAGDAPLYALESLCMRCHQNVLIPLLHYALLLLWIYCIYKAYLYSFIWCFFLFLILSSDLILCDVFQGTTRFLFTSIPNFRKVHVLIYHSLFSYA